ncbi:uncharacterized protein LOC110836683 [Zootermopsis nevadensis]|uniref:Uncharacterized protein n=1 Tax=Zootermopsis nevadensis TaxID=136037 RepID=A0A067RX13_ZOONE|nr:uncharacterized protein LOC110836683 [Zootermopsis nevadensis]XP_021933937.1 uncharacterized protein LOC110836683 [Zootermopsis nevadensis]KDR24439.1 hypothetical protein L798_06506 [Zootermopsis nevadensis]
MSDQNKEQLPAIFRSTNMLTDDDIFEILLEDLPEDDKENTDIEEEKEDAAIEVAANSSAFDRIFYQEIDAAACEAAEEDAGNPTENVDVEPLPTTSPILDIDRKWRKRDLETKIPHYSMNEGAYRSVCLMRNRNRSGDNCDRTCN